MKATPDEVIQNMEKSVKETFNFFQGKSISGAAMLTRLLDDWQCLRLSVLDGVQNALHAAKLKEPRPDVASSIDALTREVRELKWVTALVGTEDMHGAKLVVSIATERADMQAEGE